MSEPQEGAARAVTIIVTDHWTHPWFEELILPTSRYASADVEFLDISHGTVSEHIAAVAKSLQLKPHAACFACTDCAMQVYAAAVDRLRMKESDENAAAVPTGANFHCFWIATNKLACRDLLATCNDLRHAPVLTSNRSLPDLGVDGFFKPLAECGSKGVFRYAGSEEGAAPVNNPLYQQQCDLVVDDALRKLASQYEELRPYMDPNIVGIVEEYVDPRCRRTVVSIDGYVYRGEIFHYCISDNVYKEDAPETFDSLVAPSQRLSERDIKACWEKYDCMVAELVARGVDNQFVDLEAFVLEPPPGSSDDASVVIKSMEVNCRTFCNMLPIFSKMFGGKNGVECMFSAAVDMLFGIKPPISETFATGVVPAADGIAQTSQEQHIGVCSYMPLLRGCPALVESVSKDAAYYAIEGFQAQVYAVGTKGEAAARQRCDEFYQELRAKFV